MANKITALAGISNQALAKGELPTRVQFLKWGDNPSDKGVYKVNELSAAALRRQIAEKSYARLVLDFEHNSCPQSPNFQKPPRHHAAYGNLEIVDGEGVFLSALEYTPAGKEFARDNSDLSPVIIHADDGTVLGILSVALLPNGSLHNVTFFSAEVPPGASGAQPGNPPTKDTQMPDITALEASVATLTAENKTLRTELTALKATVPDAAKLTALEGKVTALETKLATLETAGLKAQKDALLEGATAAGKVVALEATVIEKMTVAELTTHIEKVPVTVPLAARTPKATKPAAGASLIDQYNAITDPAARSKFFNDHRKELSGS